MDFFLSLMMRLLDGGLSQMFYKIRNNSFIYGGAFYFTF